MPRPKAPDGLSPKQRRFVEEYLVDLNATQAAMRAGYSAKSAHYIGQELLIKTRIADAIHAAQIARSQRVELNQNAVLQEIALLSHSNVRDYVIDDYGNLELREGAPEQAMRAVASLKKKIVHTETGVIYDTEIKLWNKPASIRMAGEHLGLFREGTIESQDVQEAQAARKATVGELRQRLKDIAVRHHQAAQHESLTP